MSLRILLLFLLCFAVLWGAIVLPDDHYERVQFEFEMLFGPGPKNFYIKSGTPFLMDIIRNKHYLTSEQISILQRKLARPVMASHYDTPDGHFKIHYDPSVTDTHYVRRCGEFMMRSWYVEVESLGFMSPISDGMLGGDSRVDVYITSLGPGTYGITYPDDGEGPNPWNDCSAYIQVNTSYSGFPPNDDPEGISWGAFKVTCAHEFFHTIHMAYDYDESEWLLEIASTWMEDVVYDYVNDYLNYLPDFYNYPWLPLSDWGMHCYGACVWFHYLQAKYGAGVINSVMNITKHYDGMNVFMYALDSIGVDISDAFAEFARWNWFTGFRDDGSYYRDGARFPTTPVETEIYTFPASFTPSSNHRPRPSGANYIMLGLTAGQRMNLGFSASSVPWRLQIPFSDTVIIFSTMGSGTFEFDVPQTGYFPLIITPVPHSSWSTSYNYTVNLVMIDKVDESSLARVSGINVFPNPFNSAVTIEFSEPASDFKIVSSEGRIVWQAENSGKTFIWQPKDVPAGAYFLNTANIGNCRKLLYIP